MTKKLYIKTYGCQMNVYDSERMAEALGGAGYETVEAPESADMIHLDGRQIGNTVGKQCNGNRSPRYASGGINRDINQFAQPLAKFPGTVLVVFQPDVRICIAAEITFSVNQNDRNSAQKQVLDHGQGQCCFP